MDLYSWLMPQDQPAATRHVQQPSSSPTMPVDDWPPPKDRPTAQAAPSNPAGAPAPAAPTPTPLDLSDFAALDDIAGPGSSSTMLSPTSFYGSYNYFMPFSNFPAWPASTSVPLSNYSSLNGATNPPPGQQSQVQTQQQQHQQSQQPGSQSQSSTTPGPQMIDPMNGSSSSLQHQFQGYPTQTSSAQQTPYTFAQPLHMYPSTPYYRQAPAPSVQGTLSPQVLHPASMMATNTGMHPAVFYGQPPPPPSSTSSSTTTSSSSSTFSISSVSTVTPQQQQQILEQQARERKDRFEKGIRPLLQSSAFTGAQAVQTLVDKITDYGSHEVESAMRLEILTTMRDGAPNHYFRAWSENPGAIEITREWLKATFKGDKPQLLETIMPLLHIIDRLPLTLESLKASKLGKIVVHLVKDAPSPAIKDMASNLERRWRQMVSSANAEPKTSSENNTGEDSRSKKRKLNEPSGASSKGTSTAAPSSSLPPAKKLAVGTSSSTKPLSINAVKKSSSSSTSSSSLAASAAAANLKASGTDTSFFSAPKSKAKLPSFKKAQPPPKASSNNNDMDTDPGVAQPSSVDPFQEALKMMKVRRDSPAVSTPPGTNTPPSTMAAAGRNGNSSSNGGKKKSVSWVADSALESIRWIERAVYDDDVKDATHVSLRDLDRGEGAALHAQLFEEVIDWSEPILLDLHEDVNRPRGGQSQEKDVQETREQTALGALYMNPSQIPESPAEPLTSSSTTTAAAGLAEGDVDDDANVPRMTAGESNETLFWSHMMDASQPQAALAGGGGDLTQQQQQQQAGGGGMGATAQAILSAPTPAVAQLLETLMMNSGALQQQQQQQQPGLDAYGLQPPSLQSLIQQLQQPPPPGGGGQYGYGEDMGVGGGGGAWADYGYHDEPDHSGRQWENQGRGRGNRGGRNAGARGRGAAGGRGGSGSGGGGDDGYRHNKRKPCSFFAQGRCKFGDQCDFAHETF